MALLDLVIGFVVSLLVGAIGIYAGARVITDRSDFEYAIITALIGAVVWWLIATFVPLIGSLLALLAWIYIINARYPGGWLKAIGIALVAYITVWIVLVILGVLNIIATSALGVPGL